MRAQARRFVETERTWARSVARYADVYGALCPQPAGGALPAARRLTVSCAASTASCTSTAAPRWPRRCCPMGRITRPSRPRRRGRARRRAARDRHAAAVDHRRRAAATSRSRTRTARCGSSPTARSTTTASCGASSQARGHRFRTGSDCETILHLYEEYGDEFVRAPERHVRVRAVGRAAPAPAHRPRSARHQAALPVAATRRRLIFASEAKAMLALPGHDAGARSRLRCQSYLALGYVPAPQSIFRGIRKLPPATLLIARRRPGRGAALLARAERRRPRRYRRTNGSTRVRARLEESVRMQMVSDVPIGAFLSGGIDSSAVVAFMAAHSDRPVKTYCDRLRRRRRRGVSTTSCPTRGRSRSCSAPTITRSSCARTSCRCCRGCSGTWTSRSPTRRSSRPTSSRSSRAAT